MQVTVKYHDNDSFTIEEIVRQAVQNYGRSVVVEVLPESTKPHDLIYHGIQQILTHRQLSLLYDKGSNYQAEIGKLRSDVLFELEELLDQVIIDNETKVS